MPSIRTGCPSILGLHGAPCGQRKWSRSSSVTRSGCAAANARNTRLSRRGCVERVGVRRGVRLRGEHDRDARRRAGPPRRASRSIRSRSSWSCSGVPGSTTRSPTRSCSPSHADHQTRTFAWSRTRANAVRNAPGQRLRHSSGMSPDTSKRSATTPQPSTAPFADGGADERPGGVEADQEAARARVADHRDVLAAEGRDVGHAASVDLGPGAVDLGRCSPSGTGAHRSATAKFGRRSWRRRW